MKCDLCDRQVKFAGDLCRRCQLDPANVDWANREVISTTLDHTTPEPTFNDILSNLKPAQQPEIAQDEQLIICALLLHHSKYHRRISYKAFIISFGRNVTPGRFKYIYRKYFPR